MADECDIADPHIQKIIEAGISRVPKPPRVPYSGPCGECGEEIEPRRAQLGYDTCITCANIAHEQNKHFRAVH